MGLRENNFVPSDESFPLLGLNVLVPSTQLSHQESPRIDNFVIDKGRLRRRDGYVIMGAEVIGYPQAIVDFQTLSGTHYTVLLTTKRQYKWNAGTDTWDDITYVDGTPVEWTGDESDTINYCVATGVHSGTLKTWLVITNGKDGPRYWDGADNFALLAPLLTYTGFVTCKDITVFYNRLVFINVDTASSQPFTVSWGVLNSLVDFEGTGSGSIIINGVEGELLRGVPLGDRLALYSQDSIAVLYYVGGDAIYGGEVLVNGVRLASARGIANLGYGHAVMRKDTISLFDGTKVLRDIGLKLNPQYRDLLYHDEKYKAWSFVDLNRNVAYFSIPVNDSSVVGTTYVYCVEYDPFDQSYLAWSRLNLANRPMCLGYAQASASYLWNDSPWTIWASAQASWNLGAARKGYPQLKLGAYSASNKGKVHSFEGISGQDNGSSVTAVYESGDFTIPGIHLSYQARFVKVELEEKGRLGSGAAILYYSTDQGQSWLSLGSLAPSSSSNWERKEIFLDVIGRSIRFRIEMIGGDSLELRWRRVWFLPLREN